jgi:hypothetical protein
MSTLDIRDFGAEVDGRTDDTDAVRDALDAASSGDTVFFPAGTTRVAAGSKYGMRLNDSHSGVTLRGEGRDSIIKQAGGHSGSNRVIYIDADTNPEDITIRDLRIDGNRANNAYRTTIGILAWPSSRTKNILVENVWVENCSETGITLATGDITVRRCTAAHNGRHGINPDTANPDSTIRVENVLSHHNDVYGIDDSCGDTVIDGFVIHDCTYGMKHTADTERSVVKNGRIRDCGTNGYATVIPNSGWPSPRPNITIDNVLSEGNERWGFRFDENADYDVGTIEARENNSDGRAAQIGVFNDCAITADEVYSYDAESGTGFHFATGQDGSIATFCHAGNPDGGVSQYNADGDLNIGEQVAKRVSNVSVPTADEVGAGSLSTSEETPPTAAKSVGGVIETKNGTLQTW